MTNSLLVNFPDTLVFVYVESGDPTDLDSNPTVSASGLVAGNLTPGSVTKPGATTGRYESALAGLPEVDRVTATWQGVASGNQVGPVNIVYNVFGGYLFTLDDLQNFDGGTLNDTTKFPLATLAAERAAVTALLERHTRQSWVPRLGDVTISGDGTSVLALPDYHVTAILKVTVDGTDYTQAQLDDLIIDGRTVHRDTLGYFTAGIRNIRVLYRYGRETVDDGAARIGLLWARYRLSPGAAHPRVTTTTSELGTTEEYAPFGPSGLPEVDAWIADHSRRHRHGSAPVL